MKIKDLEEQINFINKMLKNKKINKRLVLGRRYGYKAIDLTDAKGNMRTTLNTGMTTGEVSKYLWTLRQGYDLFKKN